MNLSAESISSTYTFNLTVLGWSSNWPTGLVIYRPQSLRRQLSIDILSNMNHRIIKHPEIPSWVTIQPFCLGFTITSFCKRIGWGACSEGCEMCVWFGNGLGTSNKVKEVYIWPVSECMNHRHSLFMEHTRGK